jgi:hypothetical protein
VGVFALVVLLTLAHTLGGRILAVFAATAIFFVMSPIGFLFIARGRLSKDQPTLDSVLAKDPRPPVVYLRPFGRERECFVLGPKTKYGKYGTGF